MLVCVDYESHKNNEKGRCHLFCVCMFRWMDGLKVEKEGNLNLVFDKTKKSGSKTTSLLPLTRTRLRESDSSKPRIDGSHIGVVE